MQAHWKEPGPMDVYAWADDLFNSSPRYATGFTELLATEPYRVSPAVRRLYDLRLLHIRSFQKIALDLFRAALNDEMPPAVLHWLMNETPDCVGLRYHRNLEDRHFTLPVFFRTDEVKPGRIIEIQCPGSAWGELQVAFEYAVEMGYLGREESPADRFAAQLTDFLRDTPVVHHLLDNASAPPGMRYFIEKTRPRVRYLSIDHGVRASDCNFIRSHAFFSICSDKDFLPRLSKVGGGVTYDLPPHILFDNKALLVLPFWSTDPRSVLRRYSGPVSFYYPPAAGWHRTAGWHADNRRRVCSIAPISAVILFEVCRVKPGAELGEQGSLSAEQFGQRRVSQLSPAMS